MKILENQTDLVTGKQKNQLEHIGRATCAELVQGFLSVLQGPFISSTLVTSSWWAFLLPKLAFDQTSNDDGYQSVSIYGGNI